MVTAKTPRISWIILFIILLTALWLRLPLVQKDLPFFYNEDEAHHFNRVVNMVKEGEYNPKYFHKPSLHFYLRMPVVAASFFWTVAQGNIRTVDEIKTGDPFGLNGYQMVASHPGIVKWNRLFSVILSLLTVIITFLIAKNLFGSDFVALLSAFIVTISPGVISDSATVGVDVVMILFATLTVLLTLKLEHDHSIKSLAIAGVCAGLTISTKYNAWLILFVPLSAMVLHRRINIKTLSTAIITPIFGFLAGSPYILVELPLFLNHAAYEVWHYKIAGHIGHTGEPGWNQMKFFFGWLSNEGTGFVILALSLLGILLSILKRDVKFLTFLIFPVLYFLYMSQQRANFTRNMIVLVPFIAVMGSGLLWIITQRIRHNIRRLLLIAITPLLIIQPIKASLFSTETQADTTESRREFISWLNQQDLKFSDIAVSGNLNFPPQIYGLTGITRIDEAKVRPSHLYLSGFNRLVVGPGFQPSDAELRLLHLEHYIPGANQYERVVKNPEIKVYSLTNLSTNPLLNPSEYTSPICYAEEDFCWINSRLTTLNLDLTKINIKEGYANIEFDIMSPWTNQNIIFEIADWKHKTDSFEQYKGKWFNVNLKIPVDRLSVSAKLKVSIDQIHSPLTQKLSQDSRRLGVAIKGPFIETTRK